MRADGGFLAVLWVLAVAAVAAASADEVNLLAMGDWGNTGAGQRAVASAMGDYVRDAGRPFAGVLLTGDNFLIKLSDPNDPGWQTTFENMYDARRLNMPFYATLGNHDYDDGKSEIELEYARRRPRSRWKLPSPYYRLDLPEDRPLVAILMLDSNMTAMGAAAWKQEKDWMAEQMQQRKGQWLVCCAHHPLFSNGDHGDSSELQREWGPLIREGKVDLYLAGHDHDLQHLEVDDWWTSFVGVGGGGATTRPLRQDRRGPFSRSAHGFAHLEAGPEKLTVRLIDSDGKVVHVFSRDRLGTVRVTHTTASDVPASRSVPSKPAGAPEAGSALRPATTP